jgi:hypothetical protein
MDKHERRWWPSRLAVTAAIVAGIAVGSYGIASAASGSGLGSGSGSSPSPGATAAPWGHRRSDETPLTGDALAKVTAAAKARVAGGTIVRVETDADGNAAYEAHMVKADGTPVTVYVNKSFDVVSVQSGMPGPPPNA